MPGGATTPAKTDHGSGQPQLNQRWRTFDARKKRPTIAAVGVARELAGWCWSLAVMDEENNNKSAMNRAG